MSNIIDLMSFLNELQVINDIIEHSENIIFAKDLTGRYTLANNASVKYFEKTKDQVIGKTDHEIFSDKEAEFNSKMDNIVITTGMKKSYEKVRTVDNQILYYYVTKDLVKDKLGRIVGLSGTVVDITEYKHEQQDLATLKEKARTLQIANKVKYNFMQNLSHNLRTPLMGILGASIMNVDEFDRFKSDRKDLELFKYSAELLLNIVNEMVEFEPLIYHEIKLINKPFKMLTLVRFIEELFTYTCKEAGMYFSCEYGDAKHTNLLVNGDFQKLLQVITKILIFSLRFSPIYSKLLVRFSTLLDNDSLQIKCFVSSTAAVPEDVRSRMFQFYTEEDEKDILEHSNALGLEMYIAKRVVDAFKGTIEYKEESENGEFEISVSFPVVHDTGKVLVDGLSELSVLIADDNKINQTVLKKMVQRLNVKTIEIVDNGEKALQIFKEYKELSKRFDLILMDIQMPVMNGITATKQIRSFEKEHELRHVPILAVTAFVTEQDREECYEAGIDGFLGKPVTQSLLSDVIVDLHMKHVG